MHVYSSFLHKMQFSLREYMCSVIIFGILFI